jgi:hypothetical protein
MTQLTIKVDGELVRKGLQDLSAEIPKIGRRQIYDVMVRIRNKMRKPGQHPNYPIQWDSEKQRRAFFATDGFGRGIPSRRTGGYAAGWNIDRAEPNGYVISNSKSYTKYVGGDAYGQVHSGIHAGRWNVLRDVADEEVEKLPEDIEKEIVMVARRNGL